jgi:hypothetical protein
MKPIYATGPINVGGCHYQAGEEITCGAGARVSLLRFRQATEVPPSATDDSPPDSDNESEDDISGDDNSLAVLGLDDAIVKSLADNEIHDLDQLIDYIDNGGRLRDLKGIGAATEKRIQESIEQYLPDGE